MSAAANDEKPLSFNEVLNKAAASALRGGTAGACAMGANVACLMWMRTTVRIRDIICFHVLLLFLAEVDQEFMRT